MLFQLLAKRCFFPLFLTQFFGAFNDNAFKSALIVLITFSLVSDISHAQMLVNMAGALFILPFFLFSAMVGQLADKFDRIYIIRIIKVFEIIFMLIGALGFYLQQITLLMFTLFLMGVHSAFFGPIKYSVLPDLLQPKELLSGNALIEASTFIAILLGTILGTSLGVNMHGALLTVSISVLAGCVGLVSSFFIPRIPLAEAGLKVNWNIVVEIGRLIRLVKNNPLIFRVILTISWFWFMGFVFVTQFPIYTKDILHGNQYIVTLFLILFSVGVAVGALLCSRFLKGVASLKYVPVGIIGMSLFVWDFCWASQKVSFIHNPTLLYGVSDFILTFSGARISLDLFLLSACGGFYAVPLYAIMQSKSPAAMRSRIVGCNNIFNAIFMVVAAIAVISLVAMGCSVVQIFAIISMANLGFGIWVWRTSRFD